MIWLHTTLYGKGEKEWKFRSLPHPYLKFSSSISFFFVSVLCSLPSTRRLRFYIVIIFYGRTFYFPNDLAILTVPLNPFHFLSLFFFFSAAFILCSFRADNNVFSRVCCTVSRPTVSPRFPRDDLVEIVENAVYENIARFSHEFRSYIVSLFSHLYVMPDASCIPKNLPLAFVVNWLFYGYSDKFFLLLKGRCNELRENIFYAVFSQSKLSN